MNPPTIPRPHTPTPTHTSSHELAPGRPSRWMPPHKQVREIYKTCYPGFGAATGSGAYAPGLQAGGSSTKAATNGVMLGKGVAAITRKVEDENMRKRLDTRHVFLAFIKH